MKYISKGIVVNGSTEQILHVTRCGVDFQLTGEQAALWLNGRFAFAQCKMENPRLRVALEQLRRQELQDHIVEGQCQFDPVKVRLALELVKHEIEKSIQEESLKAD